MSPADAARRPHAPAPGARAVPAGPRPGRSLHARVFLTFGDLVVVANHRGQPWFFLLGGHVPPGEGVEEVLHRVLRRTAGFEVRSLDFVGGVEHLDPAGGTSQRIDVVFAGAVPRYAEFGSRIDDIDIVTLQPSLLRTVEFRPARAGRAITDWLTDRQPRWYTDGGSAHPPNGSTH
ncbi:NUDIX domain-containing protein [Parafrankia sp. FMc6]|uniref:NUDIX domain-containing protein n=1 Tax=Parafrankia soli TaxID=2599596 RepID=UPI0034D7818A